MAANRPTTSHPGCHELWNDVRFFKLFPALVAGTLSGVVYGVNCAALATVILGGPLSSYVF